MNTVAPMPPNAERAFLCVEKRLATYARASETSTKGIPNIAFMPGACACDFARRASFSTMCVT